MQVSESCIINKLNDDLTNLLYTIWRMLTALQWIISVMQDVEGPASHFANMEKVVVRFVFLSAF